MISRGKAIVLVALTVAATLTVAGPAGASPRSGIRSISLKNATVPGSTCDTHKPIRLHNGVGRGAKFSGGHLILRASRPLYGDVTHDGRPEAFLPLGCDTGGGTAASQVKFTYAVFADRHGHARLLGVIASRYQRRDTHTPLLSLKVRHQKALVTEYVYGPADADCCASFRAHSTWVVRSGKVRETRTALVVSDLLERPGSLGRARLGMTTHQLHHAYGGAHPEAQLGRHCYVYAFGREYDQAEQDYVPGYAVLSHGHVTVLQPNSGYVATDKGAGMYSDVSTLRHIYPHRVRISHHGLNPGKDGYALVHLKHSWLQFHLTHLSYDGHKTVYADAAALVWSAKPHGSGC